MTGTSENSDDLNSFGFLPMAEHFLSSKVIALDYLQGIERCLFCASSVLEAAL